MRIYRAIERLDYQRPIQFTRPLLNRDGTPRNNILISDDGKFYDADEYATHDYFGDCPELSINVRRDEYGRGYVSSNKEGGAEPLSRLIMRCFDDGEHDDEFFKNMEIDHKDPSVPLRDVLENLEWVTHDENMARAAKNGLMIKKYNKPLVHEICSMLSDGKTSTEIMTELNVNRQLVNDIAAGRSHKQISMQYIDKGFKYNTIDEEDKKRKCEDARIVCECLEKGMSTMEIEKEKGIDHRFSSAIKHKHTYQYISKDYNF